MQKVLALVLIGTLLSGCSTNKIKKVSASESGVQLDSPLSQVHQTSLKPLDQWSLEGKVAASKGDEGGNARFNWAQNRQAYDIQLFGPFGGGSAYILGDNTQVVLKDSEGNVFQGKDPQEVVYRATGLIIPVTGLAHWVKGVPDPKRKIQGIELSEDGLVVSLLQGNWRVSYDSYQEVGDKMLPRKMTITQSDIKVKLILKQWSLK